MTTTETVSVDVSSPRPAPWALSPSTVPLVALGVVFFLVLAYIPLGNPLLWGELIYGRWILDHGTVPTADPVMPFAEGMRVLDSSWLAETALAALERAAGFEGLAIGLAVLGLAAALILLRAYRLRAGRRSLALAGLALVLALSWSAWTSLSSESLGLLGFAILLRLLAGSGAEPSAAKQAPALEATPPRLRRLWIGLPLLFLLWANLHFSFAYGLAVLGALFLGRLLEVAWRRPSLRRVLSDPPLRRRLVLLEVSLAACLLNPRGIDLLLAAPWWTTHPNAGALPGVSPLVIGGFQGWAFAVSVALAVLVLRHGRRPMSVADALLLALFTAAALLRVGMIPWYAMMLAYVLLPQAAELVARRRPRRPLEEVRRARERRWGRLAGPSWHYTLLAVVLLWAGFAFSPLSAPLLGREGRAPRTLLASSVPLGVSDYLGQQPPETPIFNPWWWGDWLAGHGPAGLRPFATSRVEAIPAHVWRDYERIAGAGPDWQQVLERYRVHTVVLDRVRQAFQVQSLRNTEIWYPVYEDIQAVIFQRVAPAGPLAAQSDSAAEEDRRDGNNGNDGNGEPEGGAS